MKLFYNLKNTNNQQSTLKTGLILICIFLFCSFLQAQTTQWNGSADNHWENPSNWDNGVPDANKTAQIGWFSPENNEPVIYQNTNFKVLEMTNGGRPYKVTLEDGVTINVENLSTPSSGTLSDFELKIGNASVIVNVGTVNGTKISINDGSLMAGSLENKGIIDITSGALTVGTLSSPADFATIGVSYISLNQGSFTCYGKSDFAASSEFELGAGTVEFHNHVTFNGASVFTAGANSKTILDGTFSLKAGNAGLNMVFNALEITSGSQITSQTELIVETDLDCQGTLDVKSYKGNAAGKHGPIDVIGNITGAENITSLYPYIIKLEVTGQNTLKAYFDKALYESKAENVAYYKIFESTAGTTVANTIGNAALSTDGKVVTLTTDNTISENEDFVLFVQGGGQYSSGTSIDGVIDDVNYNSVNNTHKKRFQYEPSMNYSYQDGVWSPMEPSANATLADNINVMDGIATFSQDMKVNNITVNSGATLYIERTLTIAGDIVNNGTMTFKNNANSRGQLAEVPSSSTINGEFTVERFIPAGNQAEDEESHLGRAYRFMTSAVTTTGTIHANWQEGATSYNDNPKEGYGAHITGLNTIEGNTENEQDESKDQQNGFDYTPSGNPSLYVYDNENQVWSAIDNTNTNTLSAGAPYQLMVRGDRSVDVTNSETPPTNTILEATGMLHIGDFIKTDLGQNAEDFNFFGNPYQAAVDMTKVVANSTNINPNSYIIYDPTLNTRGAFVSVELKGNAGSNSVGSDANQFLQAGQAAFVTTDNDGAAQLLFKETDKATGEPQTEVFSGPNNKYINMQLLHNTGVSDGVRIYFGQNDDNEVLSNDAPKYGNLDENLAVVNAGNFLSIEHRATPTQDEVLPLFVNQYRHSNYSFKAEVPAELGEVVAYLDDAYLNTHSELPSGETTLVSFEVDQDIAESVATDRFSISFEPKVLSINEHHGLSFSLWPNPTQNRFNIQVPTTVNGEMVNITIYSIIGQKVYQVQKTADTNTISIENANLNSGVYMVKMTVKDTSSTQKLIIK